MAPRLVWEGRELAAALVESDPVGRFPFVPPLSHHLLVGDNLDALKALRRDFGDAFDFIYIDPPYNSGQSLTFLDSQKESRGGSSRDAGSAWLSFLLPRLTLARNLLKSDGVLFVSIDDREAAALTLLLREIFGASNHLATLKWRKKRKPSFLDRHVSAVIEYVLVFAKDARRFPKLLGEATEEATRPVLNASNAISERLLRQGTPALCPDGTYPPGVRTNRTLALELLEEANVLKGRLTSDVRVRGRFRVSQEILDASVFLTRSFGLRRRVLESERKRKHASDDCTTWPTNEDAEGEMRQVFGHRVFDFPKPVGLVRNLLRMCQFSETSPVRCLDFFAGSGTLAAAVLAQNAEDGGKRLFTCVQSPEPIRNPAVRVAMEANAVAWEMPSPQRISDITVARIRHALSHYGTQAEFVVLESIS